jgi:hypothetical protein
VGGRQSGQIAGIATDNVDKVRAALFLTSGESAQASVLKAYLKSGTGVAL